MREDPRYRLLRPQVGPDADGDAQRRPTAVGPSYLVSRAPLPTAAGLNAATRRSKWPWRILLAATAVLGLAGGLFAGAPSAIERYALGTLARIEARFGVELSAASVDWTLGGEVRATNVTVTAGGVLLATIASVDLSLDVSLFDRSARLVSATVDKPRVELTRHADGTTNLDPVLRALRERKGGSGGSSRLDLSALGAGGLTVTDLEVVVTPSLGLGAEGSAARAAASLGLEIPARIELRRGKVQLDLSASPALSAAKPEVPAARAGVSRVALSFADTSLDPGQSFAIELGFSEDGTLTPPIGPLGRLERLAVSPARPVRFWLGERVVGLGGVALTRDGIELFPLQLSVPVPERAPQGEVSAAATVGRLVIGVPDLGRLLEPGALSRLGAELGRALSGQGPSPITRLQLASPVLALAVFGPRHSFEDLVALAARPSADAPPQLPKAAANLDDDLLISANRAAVDRLRNAPRSTDKKSVARVSSAPMAKAVVGLLTAIAARMSSVHDRFDSLRGRLDRVTSLFGELAIEDAELALDLDGLPLDLRSVDLTLVRAIGDANTDLVLHIAGESPFDKDQRFAADLRLPLPQGSNPDNRPVLWSVSLPAIPLDALGELPRRLHLGSRGKVALVMGARQTAARIEVDFDLSLEGVTFQHPSIASAPITDLHGRVEGRLIFDVAAQELSLRDLVLRSDQLALTGELDLVSALSAPRVKLSLDLPETSLSDIIGAIPVGLIPQLAGLRMDGRLAWRLTVDLDTTEPSAVIVDSTPRASGVRVLSLGERLDLSALRTAHTYTIRLFDGTPGTRVVGPATASWVPLSNITPHLPLALTTTEDGTFYTNDGISTFAMKESIATNLERGSFVRGASTITQQLVKNLFLGGDKTVSRKLQEVFIAWQVAQFLSKDEIMALYLNTIEFGPGIYGVGDASWHWFGKRPIDLTLAEAVFLASIVPGPRRYYTFYEQGGITPRWASYLEALMKVMVERKKLTADELALNLPVAVRFRGHGGGYTDEAPADFDLVPERDDLIEPAPEDEPTLQPPLEDAP